MTPTRSRTAAVLASAALAFGALTCAAAPAAAAARVDVAGPDGTARADVTYSTRVSVRGTGFQSVAGGFGGIYVFFGWVDPDASWRPSEGGRTGADYLYVPDSEAKDNAGFQRFVAYPGSETAESANGGTIAADGTWSTTLTIPGPRFQAADRSGGVTTVDCREVQCGVLTIGAHGVVNARNESFTPVAFADLDAAEPSDEPTGAPGEEPADDGAGTPVTPGPTPTTAGPADVGVGPASVVRGRVLSFTGRGFAAGEQVVGALAGGQAAVGPLTAGPYGEVAGVLAVPLALAPGTTTLTLTGAASGQVATADVTVLEDPVVAAARANDADRAGGAPVLRWALVGLAGALLVLVLAGLRTARRRRTALPVATAGAGA
ncbi:hypothetical protein [Cellulomonas sp.]|uniref:hypothetical protein n=1 Tax=Cellulomonas sp. TaxID=40001 RepID=UPI002589D3D7|nr:hypothetical protein [Cellulomonas sp.]MCR6689264.1 hypothetical protein [Cellulomonas sp.]